jgi:peptidoglycan hydrolase-like protein with peptidoglycan-binding domain
MRLGKALIIRFFCIPVLCAAAMTVLTSAVTFASTSQQAVASDTTCPVLKKGSTDASAQGKVSVLQKELKDKGENLGTFGKNHDGIDGNFGSVTLAAVKSFQGKNKDSQGHVLLIDGIVGDRTWWALGGCNTPQQPASAGVPCVNTMNPLVRLYKAGDKSSVCYNAVANPPETVSGVTAMCINTGVQVVYEAPAGSTRVTINGGDYYVNKDLTSATTIHIIQITDPKAGFHINYCGID